MCPCTDIKLNSKSSLMDPGEKLSQLFPHTVACWASYTKSFNASVPTVCISNAHRKRMRSSSVHPGDLWKSSTLTSSIESSSHPNLLLVLARDLWGGNSGKYSFNIICSFCLEKNIFAEGQIIANIQFPRKCPRPGRTGLGVTWSNGRSPCQWQGVEQDEL